MEHLKLLNQAHQPHSCGDIQWKAEPVPKHIYGCLCMCIYIYMYIYIYIYVYKHTNNIIQPNLIIFNQQVGCPKNFIPTPSHPVGHQAAPTLWPRGAGHHPVTSPSFQSWSPGDRPKPWPQKNAHGTTPKPQRHV